MAKKKLELDKINLDDELDFDFNIDDIDGMINPDVNKPKQRKPVTDIVKGTISGAKSKLTDPSFINEVTRKALPSQYGEILDTTDKVSSSLSSLYDETIREIKPEMSRLAKKVDKLVPEESKFFKKLSTKFTQLMGNEASDYKSVTKEQLQEQSIQNALASVFKEQNDITAEEKARDASQEKIDKAVDQKRFTSNISVLRHIDQGISRLAQYNDKVNNAYQKKSLELQYRSFFVQSELLDTTKRYYEVFKAQNEGISKNTALPEYVKVTDSERFKQQAKTKFIGNIQKSLFGNNDIIGTAIDRLKQKTQKGVSDFKQAMEAGLMGLDEVESMSQMRRMMAESGVEMDSGYNLAGQLAGSGLIGHYGNKLGSFLRDKATDDTAVGQFGYKAANFLKNIPGNYESLRNSDFLRENMYGGGIKGKAASLGNILLDLISPAGPDTVIKEGTGLKGLNDIAPGFTNKAIKSLTDVIPGYLARIHREVASIRSGGQVGSMTVYDYTKDQFTTKTQLSKDIKDLLKNKSKSSTYEYSINNVLKGLVGDNVLNPELEKQFKQIITGLALENNSYTAEGVAGSSVMKDTQAKKVFDQLVKLKTAGAKGQYDFTTAMTDVKGAAPNIMAEIETFVNAGYGDLLEEQGLIKRGEDGKLEVDIDAYKRFINDTTVSSDVNVKRNIKSINPKDALKAVKNTKIYDWFYKLGKGDQQPHTGPMAQDVHSRLGNQAAPGGTKIDLTTMNGVNMAAIQALKDEQDKIVQSDKSQEWLQQIKSDTSIIVELLQKGTTNSQGSIDISSLKETLNLRKGFYTSVVEPTITGAFGAISKLFGVSKSIGQGVKDNAINPFINFVTKSYSDNKDWIQDSFKSIFKGAGDLATKVFEFGKTTLFDTIPDSVKSVLAFGTKIKDNIKNIINGPKSIFVEGDLSNPLLSVDLMKMGYYFDQATGEVIKSIDDIKGPVIDKTGEVVLTTKHIAQGLVDKYGTPIKTTFEVLLSKAVGIASSGFKRVKDFYSSIGNAAIPDRLKALFTSSKKEGSLNTDKAYDVLVEIRDMLGSYLYSGKKRSTKRSKARPGKMNTDVPLIGQEGSGEPVGAFNDRDASGRRDGDWRDRLESAVKDKTAFLKANITERYKGSNFIDALTNKAKNVTSILPDIKSAKGFKGKAGALLTGLFSNGSSSQEAKPVSENDALDTPVDDTPDISGESKKQKVSLADRAKAAWNDRDASGRRDGDWRDRLDSMKEKAKQKKETLKADLKERYRGENVIDMIGKKAMSLLSFFTGKGGSLFGSIGDIVTTVGSSLGLGKLGGLFKKAGNIAKGGIDLVAKGGKGLARVGKPIVNVLSKAKNIASVARIGQVANVARTALSVGSIMTGGVLSTAMAAAGTGLTAIAAALSSPVVLGGIAVAATGYGLYKLYKYTTRDKVNLFESIRIKQYGLLNSESDKHHNHEILVLEEYLQDGNIGYEKGQPYIITKKLDMEKILSLFSIDANDSDRVDQFSKWLEMRFKPFFLNHLTALFQVDNKIKLSEIDKLTQEQKISYLNKIGYESGPYDVTISPFKDIDTLSTDRELVTATINAALEDVKKDSDKSKSPMDVAAAKMAEVKASRDKNYWKNKRKDNELKSEQTADDIQTDGSRSAARILVDKAKDVAGKIYDKGKGVYQSAVNATSQAIESGVNVVKEGVQKGKEAAQGAYDWASSNIVQPIKNSLAGIIQAAESGKKGYNAYNRGTSGGKILGPVGNRNLTGMTISQILEDSKRPISDPQRLFAVGKYQMIPTTLKGGIKALGINPETTPYSEPVQERLFSDYLLDKKRPKISAFIKGKSDNSTAALNDAASEWASLPDPRTGSSKYGHGNKSSVKVPTLLSALQQSRDLYKQYIESGMSERDAYQKAVSTDASGQSTMLTGPTSTEAVRDKSILAGGPTVANAAAMNKAGTATNPLAGGPTVANSAIQDNVTPISKAITTKVNLSGSVAGYSGIVDTGAPMMTDQVTKQDKSFIPEPAVSYTTSKASGQGQGLTVPGVETSLNQANETLVQSLDVQRQMLSTLREILSNVNPDNIQRVQEGLKQVASQTKPPMELSKPAINLTRKSA